MKALFLAARTDDLPGVIKGGYGRAVIVEYVCYITRTVDLSNLLFCDEVSLTGKIVSDQVSFIIDIR